MTVVKVSKEGWEKLSESAFMVAFSELRPSHLDRIDFALVAEDEKTLEPLGYITCREHDQNTVYFQFGGAFHGARGTSLCFKAYLAAIEWCKARYLRIVTKISNTNDVMLKFAAKAGFLIVGVNNYHGEILLEHQLEFA